MNLRFRCPACEHPGRVGSPLPADWQCPACDQLHPLQPAALDGAPPACPFCGNQELYRKKDFPHGPGLFFLTAACLASVVTYALYQPWLTWAILIGSAAIDGVLYLWVGDVVVCYRCGTHVRGLPPNPEFKPFDLGVGERYRQEKLRREQLPN